MILSSVTSVHDIFTGWRMLQLTAVAFVALLPAVIKRRNPDLVAASQGEGLVR